MGASSIAKKVLSFWPVWILAALTVFIFWEAVFPPFPSWVLSREEGDVSTLYYYWRSYGFSELKKGIIPFWNPYIFCGVPFAAYPESALFYPLNLLFLFIPLASALNMSFILHFYLLALFQYFFLRYLGLRRWPSLLGSFTLVLSAPVLLNITAGHLSNICTFAWVPLLFLLAEGFIRTRRLAWAIGLGFFLGFQILAGHWQYVYYSFIWLILYLIVRFLLDLKPGKKRCALWLGGVILCFVIAAGIASLQILPALEASRDSFRKSLGYEWAANFSIPPLNLATFIIPGFLGDTVKSLYWGRYYFWEMCAYAGIITVLLALTAVGFRRNKFSLLFAGMALISIVLALGAYTPLFKVLYAVVPGYRFFRGSSKFLFFAVFAVSVLAASGADKLGEMARAGRKGILTALAVFTIFLALAAWFFPGQSASPPRWWKTLLREELMRGRHYDIVPPGEPSWWRELMRDTPPGENYPRYVRRLIAETPFPRNSWGTFLSGLHRLGWFGFIFGLLLLGRISLRGRSFPLSAGLCLLAAVEMITWAKPFIVGFDSRACLWEKEVASLFRGQSEPFRYLSIDPADFNRGMVDGFSCLLGYQADATRRYLEYINVSQGYPPEPQELVPLVFNFSPLLDLLNMRYIISPAGMEVRQPRFKKVLSTGATGVWANPGAVPRVLISPRARMASAPSAVLRQLQQPSYTPQEYIILEELPPQSPAGEETGGTARITGYSPREVVIAAELKRPGFLLFNDAYFPGWKAFVDGAEKKIYRANYLMRAVCLGEGEHIVCFVYRSNFFRVGLILSASVLILVMIIMVLVIQRRFTRSRRSSVSGK